MGEAPKNEATKSAEPVAAATVPVEAETQDEAAAKDDLNGTVDSKWFQDPSFVQELLGSLPGVDINDPQIQSALKEVRGDEKDENPPGNGGGASGSGDKGGSDSNELK